MKINIQNYREHAKYSVTNNAKVISLDREKITTAGIISIIVSLVVVSSIVVSTHTVTGRDLKNTTLETIECMKDEHKTSPKLTLVDLCKVDRHLLVNHSNKILEVFR